MSYRTSKLTTPLVLCALFACAACSDSTPEPPAASLAQATPDGPPRLVLDDAPALAAVTTPPTRPVTAPPHLERPTATPIGAPVMVDPATRAQPCVPTPERCNAADDDCDGGIDEGLRNACGACGAAPPEACNGVDDDCDGVVDERPTGVNVDCTAGLGACQQAGLTSCDDGALRCAAPAPIEPQLERCDAVDNDCDGATDEDLSVGETCTVGRGACEATGVWICDPQAQGVMCDADPGAPEAERCDVVDNDCDGITDEQVDVGGACVASLGALCQREGGMFCGAAGARCGARAPSAGECAAERPTTISASDRVVCAVTQGARVKCWGDLRFLDRRGELIGDERGEMGARLAAVDLRMPVHSVAVGADFACALSPDGRVKCWGQSWTGQLGQGDRVARQAPDLGGLPDVDLRMRPIQIVAGADFACALDADGQVKCWGGNVAGSLGLGDRASRGAAPGEMGAALPSVDLGDRRPVQLTAGDRHVCALDALGEVTCWGSNSDRQIGQAVRDDHRGDAPGEMGGALASMVLGMTVVDIDAGPNFTCALGDEGRVKCWGGSFGALTEINMRGLEGRAVRVGAQSCAVDDAGAVQCWGSMPGFDAQEGRMHPVALPRPILELATSAAMTCALDVDGDLRCWGHNMAGQLGQGDRMPRTSAEAFDLPPVPLDDEQR